MLPEDFRVETDSSPDTAQPTSSVLEPNSDLITLYIQCIRESKTLNKELEACQINPETIAYLIAVFQMRAELFCTAHELRSRSRARAKDGLKKIKKRHPDGAQQKRDKILKSYALQVARRSITKATPVGRQETKHKPHLGDLLVLLRAYIGKKTNDPFKIMAAVSLLFDLRPEKKECHERKGADGLLGKCEHLNRETDTCNRKNPFRAPCFENERHALWQMTRRAESRFPSDLSGRFFLPENQY